MKKTNLTVEMVYVTPEVAKNFLRFNNNNRNEAERHSRFLTKEMNEGRFIENGESIVFDINGQLKDGQHRLTSIIKSGKSYFIPIVRGVIPNAMATYDTGKNRSSADVLTLNGFKSTTAVSSFIKAIHKFEVRKSKSIKFDGGARESILTNQQVLEYCQDNYDWIIPIINKTTARYKSSKIKVLNQTQLSIITYFIGGETPNLNVYSFIDYLIGNEISRESATSYLYNKLYNAKINKEPLNFYWILGMSIKAYNYFIEGNPPVKYFKFDVSSDLPKVEKEINN